MVWSWALKGKSAFCEYLDQTAVKAFVVSRGKNVKQSKTMQKDQGHSKKNLKGIPVVD